MSKAWPVPGIDPAATLAENARQILAVRTAEYFSYAPIVDIPEAVEQLHALRIAAKRLRYTLELFRDVFTERGEFLIDQVKAVQEDLGEIHDHDVRLDLIAAELDSLDTESDADQDKPATADPRIGLIALAERERTGRQERYDAFRQRWHDHGPQMRSELVALSSLPVDAAAA
jgi:CHAD domain-containing protein